MTIAALPMLGAMVFRKGHFMWEFYGVDGWEDISCFAASTA
jgi:hypothetical protein